jgi:single-strand DNA-binding protein
LRKGATVLIEGRLQTRSWTDKQGVVRKRTEIMCEQLQLGPRATAGEKVAQTGDDEPVIGLEEEEVPF